MEEIRGAKDKFAGIGFPNKLLSLSHESYPTKNKLNTHSNVPRQVSPDQLSTSRPSSSHSGSVFHAVDPSSRSQSTVRPPSAFAKK